MKTYLVGGAVRDRLLGLAGSDRDHVVVGATPEQMLGLGFKPVGRDFPVFLHPRTSEEHALARTERKTAPGYRGFEFHADPAVSWKKIWRDRLPINAIAEDELALCIPRRIATLTHACCAVSPRLPRIRAHPALARFLRGSTPGSRGAER